MKTTTRFFVALVVFAAITGGMYFAATRSVFRIRHIEVVLDKEDPSFIFPAIREALDKRLRLLAGQFVWQVDIGGILREVEKDRRIKEAKITRNLPNAIRITVTPHKAVANILGNSSDVLYPLAPDGSVLPPIEATEAPDSPILRGEKFLNDEAARAKVLAVLEELPETGAFSRDSISEIYLRKDRDVVLLLKKTGTQVILGQDRFKVRSSQVSRVLKYLENQQMVGRVIDARYSKKVVVKLRNEP